MANEESHHCNHEQEFGAIKSDLKHLKEEQAKVENAIASYLEKYNALNLTEALADTSTEHLNMVLTALTKNSQAWAMQLSELQKNRCEVHSVQYNKLDQRTTSLEKEKLAERVAALEQLNTNRRVGYRVLTLLGGGLVTILIFIGHIDKVIRIIGSWFHH